MGRPRKIREGESAEETSHNVTPNGEAKTGSPEDSNTPGSIKPPSSPTPLSKRDDVAGVKAKYVNLKIAEDGSLDVSKLNDKSKTNLRDAFLKAAKKGDLSGIEVPETFTPESMLGYCALLMGVEAQIVVQVMKVPVDIASEVFAGVDEQGRVKPELMAVAAPMAKVANKYAGDFKYADEMALLGAIIQVTFAKIMLCRAMKEQRIEQEKAKHQPSVN